VNPEFKASTGLVSSEDGRENLYYEKKNENKYF
jgi:hypothetical protein